MSDSNALGRPATQLTTTAAPPAAPTAPPPVPVASPNPSKYLEVAHHVRTLVRHGILAPHLGEAVVRHHAPHLGEPDLQALMEGKATRGLMGEMYPHIATAGMSDAEAEKALRGHVNAIAKMAHDYAAQGYIAPHHAQDLVRRATGGLSVGPQPEGTEQESGQ